MGTKLKPVTDSPRTMKATRGFSSKNINKRALNSQVCYPAWPSAGRTMGLDTTPALSKEHQPVPATRTSQQQLLLYLSKTASWRPEPYKAIVLFLV